MGTLERPLDRGTRLGRTALRRIGTELRDARMGRGLSLGFAMPDPRDQRAWDGMVTGQGWRAGVESESAPRDVQAVTRRINLKVRDSGVDAAILLVPGTRSNREVLRAEAASLDAVFPVGTREALAALRAGKPLRANALIVLDVPAVPARLPTGRHRTTGEEPVDPGTGPESGESRRNVPRGKTRRRG